jgi:hypothetical protein
MPSTGGCRDPRDPEPDAPETSDGQSRNTRAVRREPSDFRAKDRAGNTIWERLRRRKDPPLDLADTGIARNSLIRRHDIARTRM